MQIAKLLHSLVAFVSVFALFLLPNITEANVAIKTSCVATPTSGAGAALGVAICAIPGVGQAVCVLVSLAIAAAAVIISHNKKCPQQLLVHYNWFGAAIGRWCVS